MILSLDSVCVLLVATLIAQVLIHVWTYRRYYYLGFLIPGIHGSFAEKALQFLNFFGSMEKATETVIRLYEKTRKHGPVFKIWMGCDLSVVIDDPDIVSKIVHEHLQKADLYKLLGPYSGGKSILDQNDISVWKKSRHKIESKSFSFGALESHIKIFYEESNILGDKMESLAKHSSIFDPFHLVETAGFATAVRTMFGIDWKIQQNFHHYDIYTKANATLFKLMALQGMKPWFKIDLIFSLFGYKSQKLGACKTLHCFVEDTLGQKRGELSENYYFESNANHIPDRDHIEHDAPNKFESFAESVLKVQMNPSIPTDQMISHEDLVYEMSILLSAAFDTTKLTNGFVLIFLGLYPNIQEEVYNEIINVLEEDPNITPTRSQINELHLLTRVIKETLRLFPPAPFVGRKTGREIQVGEYTVPKDCTIFVMILEIHRDPRNWPDPTRFDPDRFLPSEVAKRNPNAFMPFSLGPRNCIGYKYAMLSIKITISTILRRYRILPGDKCKCLEDIRFKFGLTMIPLPGIDIRIEKRNP